MFWWYAVHKDGKTFEDEAHKTSFSAYIRHNIANISSIGLKFVRYDLTLENGEIVDKHKYFKSIDGVKVIGYKVQKNNIEIIGKNPKLIYRMIKSVSTGATYPVGCTFETDNGFLKYDDMTGAISYE
jgi:hypothetical protein